MKYLNSYQILSLLQRHLKYLTNFFQHDLCHFSQRRRTCAQLLCNASHTPVLYTYTTWNYDRRIEHAKIGIDIQCKTMRSYPSRWRYSYSGNFIIPDPDTRVDRVSYSYDIVLYFKDDGTATLHLRDSISNALKTKRFDVYRQCFCMNLEEIFFLTLEMLFLIMALEKTALCPVNIRYCSALVRVVDRNLCPQ